MIAVISVRAGMTVERMGQLAHREGSQSERRYLPIDRAT